MARWILIAICLIVAVTAQEGGNDDTPATPTTTTTTSSTTTKPTTTTVTTTTTSKPTTTTQVPPSTTTPTPVWLKNVGKWFVNYTSTPNVSCLALNAGFEINVSYVTNKNATKTESVIVPVQAIASGSCGSDKVDLCLTWGVNNDTGHTDCLNFTFTKVTTGKENHYALTSISMNLTNNFDDAAQTRNIVRFTNQTLFETPLNQSYKCTKDTPIKFDQSVELRVVSLQIEAFRSTPFTGFSAELECAADDVSAVVPFAVGASLALLVVIVLIAYLIGRRRSRARGYQSV